MFGSEIMVIYRFMLAEKRILFSSKGMSTEKIGKFVMACISMVSPPLIGMLGRAFPYVVLNNLNFLEVQGYVAGTTNHLFQIRKNWHDLCIDLDEVNLKMKTIDSETDPLEY